MSEYTTLIFTTEFIASFGDNRFSATDRRRFARALELLDDDERHPSLRLHPLHGDQEGHWSVSASDALRSDDGKKQLIACSRHYQ